MIDTDLGPIPMTLWRSDQGAFVRAFMDSFREFGFAVVGATLLAGPGLPRTSNEQTGALTAA